MSDLAIREKMRVMQIAGWKDENVEYLYVPDNQVPGYKKQLMNNTMIDLGDRIIPRRRVHEFGPEKVDKPMIQWLLSLDPDVRDEAKEIIAQRKSKKQRISGPDHIKQILQSRGLLTS